MATVLTVATKSAKSMSELIKPIARYRQSGEINFQIEDKEGALAKVKEAFGPASKSKGQIEELDGVTVDSFKTALASGGGWWCNIRKSNTEPLLRLNLEAKDQKTLDKMLAQIAPMLGHRVDH
jgi:phosphomannomutase